MSPEKPAIIKMRKQDCHMWNSFCSTICDIIMLFGSYFMYVQPNIWPQVISKHTQYMATHCVFLQPVAYVAFVAYVAYICGINIFIYKYVVYTPPSPRCMAPLVPLHHILPALCSQTGLQARSDMYDICSNFPQLREQKLYAVDKTNTNATVAPNMYSGPD